MKLYEILVPTKYGDTEKPIRTKHHKEWDKRIYKMCGGLTILHSCKGYWVDSKENKLFQEKVIPVRIACTEKQMEAVVKMTAQHYRQRAIMFYKISDEINIVNFK